jgi:hypothetical protein
MQPFDSDVEDLYRLTLMTREGILHWSDAQIKYLPPFAWELDYLRKRQKEEPITLAINKSIDSWILSVKMNKYITSSNEPSMTEIIDDLKVYVANLKDLHRKKIKAMESFNRNNGKNMDQYEVETAPSVVHSPTSLIRRPSTARRPYHLFYLDSAAGGGDWLSITGRVNNLLGYWFHSPVPAWRIDELTRNHGGFINKDFEKIEYDWMEGRFEKGEASMNRLLGDTVFGIRAMESLIEEGSEILDDMTAWRALPCCMALHGRLGRQSPMHWLSADVLKIILNF